MTPDLAFSRYLIENYGVSVLPLSSFFNNSDITNIKEIRGQSMVRFSLSRQFETVKLLIDKLNKWKKKLLKNERNKILKLYLLYLQLIVFNI